MTDGEARGTRRGRILFVGINYAPELTGIAPYTAGMASALSRRGWQVQVLTAHPHYPAWRVMDGHGGWTRRARMEGVGVTRVAHYVPIRSGSLHRAVSELTFGLRAVLGRWRRPDLVVVVSPALLSSAAVTLRARVSRVPTIMWVQDIYALGVRETRSDARGVGLITALERWVANAAARVVVIHTRFREVLRRDLGVTSEIDVVRNWSHIDPAGPTRDDGLRARLGWAPDETVVLHAGNMGAKQGLENVVRAAQVAERRGSPVRFVLLGDGNQRQALESMGASPNLQFLDPLPEGEFERALASADMLLVNELPGLQEMAVPSKLTTYFATGLPVVAAVSPGGITEDEVRAAGAGPCVPAGDPAALVDAVEELARQPQAARAHGLAGRRYRDENLGEQASVQAFEDAVTASLRRP